jgi:signal peptidase
VRIGVGVMMIGMLLFALTGLSSPFLAVASGSMEPKINTGDMVVITATDRYAHPKSHGDTGVVTVRIAEEMDAPYRSFNGPGDVITFTAPSADEPVIHRAHFWVNEGENWVDTANPALLDGRTECNQVKMCPAPNAGLITAGDNNNGYDQALGEMRPVKPDNIIGVAEYRTPWLGNVRILFELIV